MKKLLTILVLSAITLTAGCTVKKDLFPVGGSKADGVIRLGYTFDQRSEIPLIDLEQGLYVATKRCQKWGYSGAEIFGGSTTMCSDQRPLGCVATNVTYEYQCTGDLKEK
ncbi:YecR family lipoprotein [Escherichia coli O157]|nr:YecR family lipoprotein [Escherichia coli O157]